MKNLITAIIVIASSTLFAQDNTLPSTGRVGVGTLTPSAQLDVNGNMIIDSCLLIKDSLIVNKAIRAMDRMIIEQKMTMKGDAIVKQDFRVNGNSRVDGNLRTIGNVKVEGLLKLPNVNSLSNANIIAGNYNFLAINNNGVTKSLNYADLLPSIIADLYMPSGPLIGDRCFDNTPISNPRWANGTNKIYTECPQVFVGVGTQTPRVQLDVVGGTGIYGRRISLGNVDPTIPNADFQMKTVYSLATNPNKELFVVENVDRKLFVIENSGLIRARHIKVDLETWSDYVFEKDYQLMPLQEVEKFIAKEGHLPNIPSTEEVKKEGVDLGEMNRLLLEKIEELTLHLIAQEKRISELETNQQ